MKTQTYKNHIKFYPPHHFVYLPLLIILLGWGVWNYFNNDGNQLIWGLFSIIVFLILFLALMVRQHYALGNQNRMVRLEFKQRYFELYGKRSDEVEEQLKFDQIAALRFAYDDEFKTLLNKVSQSNISGAEIKRSITNWKGDYNRI